MGFIATFFDSIFNSEEYADVGKAGERFTYRIMDDIFPKRHILRNVYLLKKDGKYTEIDLLAVSTKGIFVVESKNYSGWIFGDENNDTWVQTMPKGFKNNFFNPIIQNNVHIKCLQHNLGAYANLRYYSLVVFSERCEIKKMNVVSENTFVIQRQFLKSTLKKMIDGNDVITKSERDAIISTLAKSSRPDDDIKEQHLAGIDESFKQCPFCKIDLVERTNKTTGEIFYGCKNYPKCKYTKKDIKQLSRT